MCAAASHHPFNARRYGVKAAPVPRQGRPIFATGQTLSVSGGLTMSA